MTIIVGVRCTDGIVVGTDSVATSAMGPNPLVHLQSNSKIQIFPENVIVAATGAVGFTQRLYLHVEAAIKGQVFRNMSSMDCATNIAKRLLTDFQNSMVQKHPQLGLAFGGVMVAPFKDGPCLVEFATTDFQPEIKKDKMFFVSMGSGQVLADPFLAFVSRVLWKNKMPSIDAGKFGVYWVLDHTIRLAPMGIGGPIKLAVLKQVDGNWVAQELDDTQEAALYVSELEVHIGKFARSTIEDAPTTPPPVAPREPS
jgi:Proteasome subunit